MINLMRKNQRWLMMLISIVVIVAFVFLYNRADLEKLSKNAIGTIYGKPVTNIEFGRMEKQFDVARILGMYDLLQILASGGSREPMEDYVWNTLVLREKANRLLIEPGADAITAKIQSLQPFQNDGQFDFTRYQAFVANVLSPRGFSEEQFNDLVRDELRLEKLRELIATASITSEEEVREAYGNAFRKRHLQVVKLPRDTFAATVKVTPEEIKSYFDKNQSTFKSDEKRSVKYIALTLAEADRKLTGKEKVAKLQPISLQADDFSQRMLKPGAKFDAIASELKLPIKETAPFTSANPPAEIAGVTQAGPAVFALTAETPDSDVFQADDGFYIFHLEKIEPSVPQTLAEATPKITNLLQEEKIATAMTTKAAELQKAFQAALKAGQTFAQAAEAAGLKAETLPPYSPAELQQSKEMNADRIVQMRAASLAEGAVSDLLPTTDGGAIAYVEKLEPLDDAKWKSDRESIMERYSSSRNEVSFAEWFRAQRAAANVRIGATAD